MQHDRESRGALAYLALAGEMLRREDEQQSLSSAPEAPATAEGGAPGAQ